MEVQSRLREQRLHSTQVEDLVLELDKKELARRPRCFLLFLSGAQPVSPDGAEACLEISPGHILRRLLFLSPRHEEPDH